MSRNAPSPDYIDIDCLSQRSGLSKSTLRRLVKSERIPYLQPAGKGGKLLFPADALESLRNDPSPLPPPPQPDTLPGRTPHWRKPR